MASVGLPSALRRYSPSGPHDEAFTVARQHPAFAIGLGLPASNRSKCAAQADAVAPGTRGRAAPSRG
eukprot:4384042-Pyramimonas_sp.AAC.1